VLLLLLLLPALPLLSADPEAVLEEEEEEERREYVESVEAPPPPTCSAAPPGRDDMDEREGGWRCKYPTPSAFSQSLASVKNPGEGATPVSSLLFTTPMATKCRARFKRCAGGEGPVTHTCGRALG